MALSLKIAQLYADMKINMAQFDADMARMKAKMMAMQTPKISPTINTGAALAGLNAIMAKLAAINKAAVVTVTTRTRTTTSGGGGGGSSGKAGGAAASTGPGSNFIPLAAVQASSFAAIDKQRAAQAATAAFAQKVAAAQVAAAAKVVAAQQSAAAKGQAGWQRAYAQQAAASAKAAAAQVRAAQRVAAAQAAASAKNAAAFATNAQHFGTGLGQGLGTPYLSSPQQAVGMAIGAVGKEAVTIAVDIEKKMAEVRRVAGLSADETERLKKALMEISTVQAGASLDDLIKIAETGAKMGIAGKDLRNFTADLAMVKNAVEEIPAEDLANGMNRVLTVFQRGPEYIRGMGSAMAAMGNASTATTQDLIKISEGLSGTAQSIGMTIPQVLAFASILKDTGLSNAVGSSSFSQIFRRMGAESEKFAKTAGIDAKEFANAYRRDPIEALQMLFKALENIKDTIEGQEFIADLGLKGVRAAGGFQQAAAGMDKYADRVKSANAEFTTLKSLMDANAIKGDTAAAALGKLANAATALAESFANPLLPQIKELTNDLTEMAKAADMGAMALASVGANKGAKALDNSLNGTVLGMITNKVGSMMGFGTFNGFQQLDKAIFGKPAPLAGLAPRPGAPALPPPPASIPTKTGDWSPEGMKDAQGAFANRIKLALTRAQIVLSPAGNAMGNLGQQLAKSVAPQSRPGAAVGLSGQDFGRMQQQMILDNSARDTAKNTATTAETLVQIWQLMQRTKGNAINALLGP